MFVGVPHVILKCLKGRDDMCNNAKRNLETLAPIVEVRSEIIDNVVDYLANKPRVLGIHADLYKVLLKTCDAQFNTVEEAMRND